MKTFILMWNPAISSFKKEEFDKMIPAEWFELNWSVWDWKAAEDGDRFFMVRVGEGNTGIVMAGKFDSEPWHGEDWSGKGREVYYVDLSVDTLIDSDKTAYISTEELTNSIPEFDWTGGHSGRLVTPDVALKLEMLWKQYLYTHQDIFDDKVACTTDCWNGDMVDGILEDHIRKTRDNKCEVCGYDYKQLWGDDCEESNDYWLFWPSVNKKTSDNFMSHIRCLCSNCNHVDMGKLRERLGEPQRNQNGLGKNQID